MQKILFLDIASHPFDLAQGGCVACVTDDHTVALIPVDHRIGDAELPTLLEQVLARVSWTPRDLTRLACVIGPGGFTSLRVGVAAINALSYALKIPATGIHLSDLYRCRVSGGECREGLWMHSTKKTALFLRDITSSEEPRLVALEDLPSLLIGKKKRTGELIPEHRAVVDAAGLMPAELRPLEDVLPDFLARLSYDSRIQEPWYGRGW